MRVPVQTTPRTQRQAAITPFVQNRATAANASGADLGNALVQAASTVGNVGGLLRQQAEQAQRFGVLQSYAAFNASVDEKLEEMKRTSDPRLGNFADIATASYDSWEQEWLNSVPDEFHDEFATRAADTKANVARNALAFQYESTDNYFRQGVQDQVNLSLQSLDQDGTPVNLAEQRAVIDEYINTSTLTEAEKVSLRRTAYRAIESVSYKSEVRRGNLEADALGVGGSKGTAVDLIMQFDGPSLENGLDYETNRELLTERVEEAQAGAMAAIGSLETWESLPDNIQAVLTSIHDDLGELPSGIVDAINNGDLTQLVGEIKALGGERREMEAELAAGNADMPQGFLDADPTYANIPYEDRLALRADAERELKAERDAEAKAAKAQQEAQFNSLLVGIMDGGKGQYHIDEAREQGWLTDYDEIKKAQDALDARDEGINASLLMQQHIATGIPINPGSQDDRDMFNAYIGEEGIMAMRELNGDYVTQVLVPAVRAAGDLPTDTVGLLTGMMRAQDPQMALFALDALNQLEQASPEAYQARVNEAVAADVEYWRQVKDYLPMEDVLSSVRGGTTQEERTRNTMLREEARGILKETDLFSDVTSRLGDLPGWRLGDPTMTPAASDLLQSDFNRLFEREYAHDGNVEQAKNRAITALGKVWNTTDIGGQQTLMRYPPELVGYQPWNGSHEWLTEQGRAELELEPGENFQLISDEQTKAEYQAWQTGGPRPSYIVLTIDSNGVVDYPKEEDGSPRRLFFEVTPEMEEQKLNDFQEKQAQLQYDTIVREYDQARRLWRRTGTAIPPEIQQAYEAAVAERGVPRNTMLVFQGWGQ